MEKYSDTRSQRSEISKECDALFECEGAGMYRYYPPLWMEMRDKAVGTTRDAEGLQILESKSKEEYYNLLARSIWKHCDGNYDWCYNKHYESEGIDAVFACAGIHWQGVARTLKALIKAYNPSEH